MRIAVVGAGAAGLSAARGLVRQGHTVTVLEPGDRVGGKCWTIAHRGRSYELGAGAMTSAYREVRALLDEHGLRAQPGLGGVFLDADGQSHWSPPSLRAPGWWRVGFESARLLVEIARERRVGKPGFRGLSPSVTVPFAEWARQRSVERAVALAEPWFTGFGYGRFEDIAAAYVLKYLLLFRAPIYELLDSGYQGLWERVAAPLDVRLGVTVERVRRGDDVVVSTSTGELRCDALVVACPLDAALGFLDASDEERELFARIRYNDYHVVAVELSQPPRARYGFFAENFARPGEPVFFYRRWLENDLVLFYCSPAGGTLDDSEAAVRRLLARLGGQVRDVVIRHAWRYFPHVSPADIAGGYYDRLEALQGQRRTYYAGELLSFTAVESVVAYSSSLVARIPA